MITIAMVSIECTCLAFLLVILMAYIVLPRTGSLKRDGFFLCLISLMAGLVFDLISWACEYWPAPGWLQYSGNTLCLISSGFIISFFAYYIVGQIREVRPVSWLCARVISIANLCGSVVVLAAALCGKLFLIVPYPDKPDVMVYLARNFIYDIPNYLSAMSLTVLFVIVLRNASALGRNKIVVFAIYFLAPLAASALELINEELQFSFAITCVNMSIVYVMLQSRHMDELLIREKLLNEWSYLDALTGLLNRRAFNRDMEASAGEDEISIAFCDLNGLKKINDEKGHSAGDEYLLSFSEMLRRHFPDECIYRISGDEFVVFERGLTENEFNRSIDELRKEIDEKSSIAALGTARGHGTEIANLLNKAETRMYEDKDAFYRKNPDIRRRRTDK